MTGRSIAEQRNTVLIGSTGTGKSPLALARARIRVGAETASTPSSTLVGWRARPAPAGKVVSPIT